MDLLKFHAVLHTDSCLLHAEGKLLHAEFNILHADSLFFMHICYMQRGELLHAE